MYKAKFYTSGGEIWRTLKGRSGSDLNHATRIARWMAKKNNWQFALIVKEF